jgi:ABC-type transport system involved in cytochrome bd biosynthesis fused ATPase/permease subunit
MSEIEGKKPYENSGIKEGDRIIQINQNQIDNTDDLMKAVNKSDGNNISIKYVRDEKTITTSIKPLKNSSNEYKIGLWVRDAAAGVGTLTFYEPSSGRILFDKIPLKNVDKISLRNQIGMFLEDMTIIKGTVYENIVLGQTHISAEQILEASEQIGIEDLSSQFSNGFFTKISETDTEISFSSKKKILLLRALVGERRLLILEDPLDGMDDAFKIKMREHLSNLKENTTVIVVSEDPEMIEIADQHLHIEEGTVKILFNKN